LRAKANRKARLKAMFAWTDEDYQAAPARFCDWALGFAEMEERRRG
jgi:hypothetical protein